MNDRQLFHRAFDPEIAARDHDHIRCFDHLANVAHGGLILDFRHNFCGAFCFLQNATQRLQVAFLPRKTERDEVYFQFDADRDVFEILLRQRWQIHANSREIDVTPRTQRTQRKDFAANAVALFLQDEKAHHSVIDQDNITNRNVLHESVVIYIDRILLFALRAADGELENVTGLEP